MKFSFNGILDTITSSTHGGYEQIELTFNICGGLQGNFERHKRVRVTVEDVEAPPQVEPTAGQEHPRG